MKLLAVLLTFLVTPVLAQTGEPKTAAQLNSEVVSNLASGQASPITAEALRQVLLDMIASEVGPTAGVTASPNTVLAGPATGTTAVEPTYRSLVAADIPALSSLSFSAVVKAQAAAGGVGFTGHIGGTGTAPVLSACGTAPALSAGANDIHGTVTEGATVAGCVITFANAYTNAPDCVLSSPTGTLLVSYSTTTTSLTITHFSASGSKFTYHCMGQ